MQNKNDIPLTKALKIFFKDALKVALMNPSQAVSFLRTILWQGKAHTLRSKLKKQGYSIPPIVIFSITNQCNLNCKGCYSQLFHPPSQTEMNIDKVKSVVKEAAELGISFFVLVLTNLIMNVAAIAISLPVALIIASYLGVAPEIILFSSLVAAGMPFLFLVGAAPNAIAYNSNQFTSGEFFLSGIPASILLLVVLGLFTLLIWPLMGMPVTAS